MKSFQQLTRDADEIIGAMQAGHISPAEAVASWERVRAPEEVTARFGKHEIQQADLVLDHGRVIKSREPQQTGCFVDIARFFSMRDKAAERGNKLDEIEAIPRRGSSVSRFARVTILGAAVVLAADAVTEHGWHSVLNFVLAAIGFYVHDDMQSER